MFRKMERSFCRLCLDVVTNGNCKIIEEITMEVLDVVLLKLNPKRKNKSVMCNACYTKVLAAFQFKATCMDTEDGIFPYVNHEKVAPVDLREIYLKQRGKEHLIAILDDEQVCRLCMQIVTCGFKSIREVDSNIISKYIPQVNFSSTKEPVVCNPCLDLLGTHSSFLNSCRERIEKTRDDKATENPFHVKTGDIGIKSEGGNSVNRSRMSKDGRSERRPDNRRKSKNNRALEDEKKHASTLGDPSQKETYKCHDCDYKTIRKLYLRRHLLRHKDPSELRRFKCGSCDYVAMRKAHLTLHESNQHGDRSQAATYKCDSCIYSTVYKNHLTRHMWTHRDPSEVPMYKCKSCDFKTRQRCYLKKHALIHQDMSEKKMYSCNCCDFMTDRNGYLDRHMITHKGFSDVPTYKCDRCDFVTKSKYRLGCHQQTHRDPSERQLYKCDSCGFQTKQKGNLARHLLTHKDLSEVQVYKCNVCGYKAKQKGNLRTHALTHTDRSHLKTYKCDTCDFETPHKRYLPVHLSIHERETLVCDVCDYQTQSRGNFARHQRKHRKNKP